MTAPTDITEVERRAYYKILSGRLRAKRVMLVERGVADAAGIGMPLDTPEGHDDSKSWRRPHRDLCNLRRKNNYSEDTPYGWTYAG